MNQPHHAPPNPTIHRRRGLLRRAVWTLLALLLAAAPLHGAGSSIWPTAHAQEGKRLPALSWDDAPDVPLHRSEADWLFDMGLRSFEEAYGPFPTYEYEVGDAEEFFPLGEFNLVKEAFLLHYRTDHAYFWFERGVRLNPGALESTARFFEEHIWPLNNRIYGDEWNPGIDGDSRIHIVNQRGIAPTVMGAFNPDDQCPRSICPQSNQREIVYINLNAAPLGSPEYLTTLAHEHQHLIQHYADGNEQRWFNEGLSQLAEHLNGFAPNLIGAFSLDDFLQNPDHRLAGWAFDESIGRYYAAGYLFMVYLYERFGLEFIQHLAREERDGLASVQATLAALGYADSVDTVFGDWLLANYFDDPYVASASGAGAYYYQTLDLPAAIGTQRLRLTQGRAVHSDTVNQYGADYLRISEPGTYTISFDGGDATPVVAAAPYSADWMWWSYNNSSSATRLTAPFDLSRLTTATLEFSAWWQMEADYDWFQVLVSADDGASWEIVRGARARANGVKAPGAYYSGQSDDWVQERVDLSTYAGQPVLVRFEYLTDSSRTLAGVALDDIRIPELEYEDTVEEAASRWVPEGFLRVPGTVPQHWTLAIITDGGGTAVRVTHPTLDAVNTARASITVPEDGQATLVIGAMAPFTATPATYKVSIQRTE